MLVQESVPIASCRFTGQMFSTNKPIHDQLIIIGNDDRLPKESLE